MADVLAAIAPGVQRLVARHGSGPDDPHGGSDAFADGSPLLARLRAASVQGGVAFAGPLGARPRRVGPSFVERSVPALGACHARGEGFDLLLQLRHSWADGTTHAAFTPTVFLAVARRILTHLALPADVPRPAPARAPPTGDHE